MRALVLSGEWHPKDPSTLDPSEHSERSAKVASGAWRYPKLAFADVPQPVPRDGEVLIKVSRCGICGTDVHCCTPDQDGYVQFSGPAKLPVILGHEFAGEVVAIGRKVTALAKGDLVAAESVMWCGHCLACRSGNLNQCAHAKLLGLNHPGAFAEFVAVDAKYCWQIDSLRDAFSSAEEVCSVGALLEPLGCAYNGMFIAAAGLRPGAYVAIHGAGPIGLGAVMLAKVAGAAKIFAFDLNDERNELALKLGADYAANPRTLRETGSSVASFIAEHTGGSGIDLQIEAAGSASETIPEMAKSFAPNGRLVYLGRGQNTAAIDLNPMVTNANAIIGSRGHSGHGIFPALIRLISARRLPVAEMITSTYCFEDALEAVRHASLQTDAKTMICF